MHCGGANDPEAGATRALFYVSFRNSAATTAVGNVGSMRADVKPISLGELRSKLDELRADDPSFDPFEQEEERLFRENRAAADGEGHAGAMFNTGLCYMKGEGVAQVCWT